MSFLLFSRHYLTPELLKKLSHNPNIEIAAHGYRHPFYNLHPSHSIFQDILFDRIALEELTDNLVLGFAVPNGRYNQITINCIKNAGMAYSRTTASTNNFELPTNWLEWNPTCHHKYAKSLCERFIAEDDIKYHDPLLFYIWGHSSEFERDNEWNMIEEILKKFSDDRRIWFATNIEIYNYINAYKSLIYSADMSKVYNPSNEDIYLAVGVSYDNNGEIVKVPANGLIKI